jgi:hypothetical protein
MSVGDGFDVRSLGVTYRDGHRVESHRHPWAQLIYARSGVMDVSTNRRLWFVPPTRAIWIPAGIQHAIAMRGEVALRTLYVAPERSQAARLPDDVAQTLVRAPEKDRWYEIARREGVSENDCETIRGAFAYEGFRLKLPAKAGMRQ